MFAQAIHQMGWLQPWLIIMIWILIMLLLEKVHYWDRFFIKTEKCVELCDNFRFIIVTISVCW